MKTTTVIAIQTLRTGLTLACAPLIGCSLLHPLDPLLPPLEGEGGTAGAAASAGIAEAGTTGTATKDAAGAGRSQNVAGGANAVRPGSDAGGAENDGSAAGAGTGGGSETGSANSTGETQGTGATPGAGVTGGAADDTDAKVSGACQKNDTRSCVEAGLYGPCTEGMQVCGADRSWGQCSILPEGKDTCEAGNDANCNGSPNEGCACTKGAARPCEDALGNCAEGVESCLDDGSGWSACSIAAEDADSCEPGDDANCNGVPNEGCPCIENEVQPCGPENEIGICRSGQSTCTANGTWGECEGGVYPSPRDCRSADDNDCDGIADNTVDDVRQCVVGETQPCETHAQDGIGICKAGRLTCNALQYGAASSWGDCLGSVEPKDRDCVSPLDNDCDGLPDSGTGGPEFVKLPEGYCIDSTEVTRAQYQAWLDTSPPTSGQLVVCNLNDSFAPPSDCMGDSRVCQTNCGNHPQVCVDWCDAYAYCKAVGKRLCGDVKGGSIITNNCATVSDQWYNACSSHGANVYPSEEGYDVCQVYPASVLIESTTVQVATLNDCQSPISGYEGVYDLSGNVAEWENSCNTDDCLTRGGSWTDDAARTEYAKCANPATRPRDSRTGYIGFRCCSL